MSLRRVLRITAHEVELEAKVADSTMRYAFKWTNFYMFIKENWRIVLSNFKRGKVVSIKYCLQKLRFKNFC